LLPNLHKDFAEQLEIVLENIPGGALTLEECKKKIADLKAKCTQVKEACPIDWCEDISLTTNTICPFLVLGTDCLLESDVQLPRIPVVPGRWGLVPRPPIMKNIDESEYLSRLASSHQ
jgi:hypothetical protein